MNKAVQLVRFNTSDQGTFGKLITENFECFTVEPPWRDNAIGLSCIPVGDYNVSMSISRKFGKVYHIHNVPGRSSVLIHTGNLAGDVTKGFLTHSHGCILPGEKLGKMGKQLAVFSSMFALTRFKDYLQFEPFIMAVKEVYNV
jgi:hypothetical protein